MRTVTTEYITALENNPFYRLLDGTPRPDHTRLKRESEIFARWIAKEHAKERRMIRKAVSNV